MSAKNSTFTVKVEQVPAGSTTFTVAPSPAGAPVGGATKDSPPAVIVATMRIGTLVCRVLVSGLVQFVTPSHVIDDALNDENVIAWNVLSSPAAGAAAADERPQ